MRAFQAQGESYSLYPHQGKMGQQNPFVVVATMRKSGMMRKKPVRNKTIEETCTHCGSDSSEFVYANYVVRCRHCCQTIRKFGVC